jgi:hypothetical protein
MSKSGLSRDHIHTPLVIPTKMQIVTDSHGELGTLNKKSASRSIFVCSRGREQLP